jgi:hypothetical protein
MRTRSLATFLLPLVLTTVAACAGADDGEGVASVSGSAAASATSSPDVAEQGRRHARCMREHGVPESDPRVQADGSVRLGGGYDKDSVDDGVMDAAREACKRYEPVLSGEDREPKTEGAREYARCMRANGVEDFPDPDADGRLRLPPEQTDPHYDDAKATCDAQARSQSAGATR